MHNPDTNTTRTYTVLGSTRSVMHNCVDVKTLTTCRGSPLQQQFHEEAVDLLNQTSDWYTNNNHRPESRTIATVVGYNIDYALLCSKKKVYNVASLLLDIGRESFFAFCCGAHNAASATLSPQNAALSAVIGIGMWSLARLAGLHPAGAIAFTIFSLMVRYGFNLKRMHNVYERASQLIATGDPVQCTAGLVQLTTEEVGLWLGSKASQKLLNQWQAVKNGTFSAAIGPNNQQLITPGKNTQTLSLAQNSTNQSTTITPQSAIIKPNTEIIQVPAIAVNANQTAEEINRQIHGMIASAEKAGRDNLQKILIFIWSNPQLYPPDKISMRSVKAIVEFKNTFPRLNMKHLTEGELNKRGQIKGLHILQPNDPRITKTILPPDSFGISKVEVSFMGQSKLSTLFPPNMSITEILETIQNAHNNLSAIKDYGSIGKAPSGMRIRYWYEEDHTGFFVNSSYPIHETEL